MQYALLHPGDPLAEQKTEILDWIEAVTGEKVPRDQPFEKVLKDGVILCNMMNKLIPGSVKRINKKGSNFQLMENHAAFQKGMKQFGVPDDEIFQTVDLFEARNVKQVVKSLGALARIASNNPNYTGPKMGPKMSEKNEKEWTEEELRAGRQGTVGLQMGSNKGASQAGLNLGKQRMIND
jgi:hypothetical protein